MAWNPDAPPAKQDAVTAVVWQATGEPVPVGSVLRIAALNGYGWFVGQDRNFRPVLVAGDRVLHLADPPGVTTKPGTIATTISDDGRVVGGQTSRSTSVVAARWTCR
jgi:hypothetical protein